MVFKLKHIGITFLLSIILIAGISGAPVSRETKNILVLNSYQPGYRWSDSLTVGIIKEFRKHPEISFYFESLNSKQFVQTRFDVTSQYLKNKYVDVKFDGVLVTDNDALDFSFRYDQYLFPDVPIVFAGISNPEDYPLEGSAYFGFKEDAVNDSIVDLVKRLLPGAKELLVILDQTTTGKIYRENLTRQGARFRDFTVRFPEDIDEESICSMVSSTIGFDAIFYVGINQDKHGNPVDEGRLLEEIGKLARVPVFAGTPTSLGKGVIGGLYQNGSMQGEKAAELLVRLINTGNGNLAGHVYHTGKEYFFDQKVLDRFGVSVKLLPAGAFIANPRNIFTESNFSILLFILVVLIFIVLFLSLVNQRRKKAQQQSKSQLLKIETQKRQLEEAYNQLGGVIDELEDANIKLNETNQSLLEAKKKAEESDNLKSAFLANVSHEIRTPLNSIVGFSSLLSEGDLDETTRTMYADLINSNTESLLVLIDEIIDLSKIEAQQLSLKRQDFSVNLLMYELYQIFVQSNHSHKVRFQISQGIKEKELFVFSDRVRVKQIFINLLSNALKFTDEGTIEMGYFLNDRQEITLYVKDTGIGISEEHHEAIFHRFRKLNENQGRIYRGTGLGLAITQKLVELLGGRIWLESEPGKGSIFYFTLQNLVLKDICL